MPPPPPLYPNVVARYEALSAALHTLLINVFLIVLVFMGTAASRKDNDTLTADPPTGAPDRPLIRLWLYAVTFVIYLAVKAIQLRMPSYWYPFTRFLDEVSLGFGIFSLIALIATITYKFLEFAVAPIMISLVILRLWYGDDFYEFLYVVTIRVYKAFAFLGKIFMFMWVCLRVSIMALFRFPINQQITDAHEAIGSSMIYWNRELQLSKTRRAAAAQVAREIADDEFARHRAALTLEQAVIDVKEAVGYIPLPPAQPAPQPAAGQLPANPLDVPALPP